MYHYKAFQHHSDNGASSLAGSQEAVAGADSTQPWRPSTAPTRDLTPWLNARTTENHAEAGGHQRSSFCKPPETEGDKKATSNMLLTTKHWTRADGRQPGSGDGGVARILGQRKPSGSWSQSQF